MRPGSRVRVTLGESTVVGTVGYATANRACLVPDGSPEANYFSTPPWTVEVLPEPVPAWMLEPGAVCQGASGDAWQREDDIDEWRAADSSPRTTAALIERGPLTRLIPVPVVPEDVQDAARWMDDSYSAGSRQMRVARWVLDLAGQQ